jgi:putative DNA primase/helicase
MEIKPNFAITSEHLKTSIETLQNVIEENITDQLLDKLIEQITPVNFVKVIENRLSINNETIQEADIRIIEKHYLIIAVEELLKTAIDNNWGLCKNNDNIYVYNGCYWSEIDKNTFQSFLGKVALKMKVPEFTAKYFKFSENLFKQFLTLSHLTPPKADVNKVSINLLNGTFEITPKSNKLKPFDRNDFITYQLPFKYDPNAKAPIFEEYLQTVLPDIERQHVLAEYIAYVFIKNGNKTIKEEKALVLFGTGANGKSVFFEIVNALLGKENTSNYSLSSITDEKGYHRAKLANKLVNYASEINGKLEAAIFKQLVSGEPTEARLPYGQPFIMEQYAKLIFNCNELPKDVEHTPAYFRRYLIIPFDVTIPPEKQDRNLHTKIIENELSGVFNWVLDGLNRLLSNKKFSNCDAAQKAIEKYKLESDSVQLFLSDNQYEPSTTEDMPLKSIYSEYKTYCLDSGFRACSNRTFSDRLRHSGYTTERKNYGTVILIEKKDVF